MFAPDAVAVERGGREIWGLGFKGWKGRIGRGISKWGGDDTGWRGWFDVNYEPTRNSFILCFQHFPLISLYLPLFHLLSPPLKPTFFPALHAVLLAVGFWVIKMGFDCKVQSYFLYTTECYSRTLNSASYLSRFH